MPTGRQKRLKTPSVRIGACFFRRVKIVKKLHLTNFMINFRQQKRLLAIFASLFLFALPNNAFGAEDIARGVRVIVLDAGHGGSKFPGASYGTICEKNINLQIVLRVGALIEKNLPDVKVVYTRKVDKLFSTVLADDLQARADIAHRNEGDLFISVHANAHRNSEVRGVETLIMGESDREQRANQNALYLNNKDELLDMSDQKTAAIVRAYISNLQFTYGEYSEMMARLIQEEYVKLGRVDRGVRRQPLKVLYATDMPSVLTEIGFMSNPAELKYITSEKGQKEISGAIFRAVKSYVENVRRALLLDSGATTSQSQTPVVQEQKSAPKAESGAKSKSVATTKRYAIQLMASVKKISTDHPELKSYRGKVWILEGSGSLKYKYCYGDYAEKGMAQEHIKEVRKEFPQAFIVAYDKQL